MRIRVVSGRAVTGDVVINAAVTGTGKRAADQGKNVGDISCACVPARGRATATTCLTVCVGPADKCNREVLRCAGGSVAKWLGSRDLNRAALDGESVRKFGVDDGLSSFCEGFALGAFRFDRYRHAPVRSALSRLDVYVSRSSARLSTRLARVGRIVEAVNLSRDWGHEPPNVINPVTLARRVRSMARRSGLTCRVLDDKQLAKLKARALLAVGAASKSKPRLIVLEYAGTGRRASAKPLVLVGKAITFDTGGYSLKDKDGIVGMKYDKCGGMAVIGAMRAAAALKLKTPIVGVIAAAENMIAGDAYRPNDIVKTMSGKTVEIISTDAEGRMVLADALTFVQKRFRPRAIIDLATLTGGVVVALGSVRAGLFSNNDTLADVLSAAGDRTGERLWRMPLDDEYFDLIKGGDSDLKNSGGRSAHPVIGGMFLKQFVSDKIPWAHLDIAGTATTDKDLPYCPKGATGFGVRLLVDYLEHL